MKVYLLNALITPFEADESEVAVFVISKISKDNFVEILRQAKENNIPIESAIGHQATVDFLKELVPEFSEVFVYNRSMIYLEEGDMGLVVRVAPRGERIREYQLDELRDFYKKGEIEFIVVSRVYAPEVVFKPLGLPVVS